ncbi:hypothetical protein A2U01_0084838, partial [Trifolium medium]|nr:hypothetical protein [Trifolium medium]
MSNKGSTPLNEPAEARQMFKDVPGHGNKRGKTAPMKTTHKQMSNQIHQKAAQLKNQMSDH